MKYVFALWHELVHEANTQTMTLQYQTQVAWVGSSHKMCVPPKTQVIRIDTGSAIRQKNSRQDQIWTIIHGQEGEGDISSIP